MRYRPAMRPLEDSSHATAAAPALELAVLGLDHRDLVIFGLEEVDVSPDPPRFGHQLQGPRHRRPGWQIRPRRFSPPPPAIGRLLVLGSSRDGVGRVYEHALHVLEVKQALAVDELVAHSYRHQIGVRVGGGESRRLHGQRDSGDRPGRNDGSGT